MIFVFSLLTMALVVVSLFLILLVLVQLPKKDAGATMAFGGGAADALFGAGSGNVLTNLTKWFAVAFFLLALTLGGVHDRLGQSSTDASGFERRVKLQQQMHPSGTAMSPAPAPTKAPAAAPAATPAPTNSMQLLSTPNAPLTPATNH